MIARILGRWSLASLIIASVLIMVPVLFLPACSSGGQPAAQPTQAAAKPASQPAQPAANPAAQPAQSAPKPAGQVVELRAGCGNPKGDVTCIGLDALAEIVEKKSNGELVVRNFYNSLGSQTQLAQSVMQGSVDIGQVSNGNAAAITSGFLVYDLPFLFKSYDNILKSLDGPIGRKAIETLEKDTSVKYLFSASYGASRDIQTRHKQIKTPADIKGLKVRVVNTPIDLATVKSWGANPTVVEWAQLYPALQQGVVDGMNAIITGLKVAKWYEVVKYNIRLDYQAIFEPMFVNGKKFASLSPQHQKILLEAAVEADARNRKEAAERVTQDTAELKQQGMQIYEPTKEDLAQWTATRESVWKEVAEQQKGKIDLDVASQLYQSQQ